jgi:hypothetical protein
LFAFVPLRVSDCCLLQRRRSVSAYSRTYAHMLLKRQ